MADGQPDILAIVEKSLRSSPALLASLLGTDRRSLRQIIDSDKAIISRLGLDCPTLAGRMMELTRIAKARLELAVTVDRLEVYCQQWKGKVACPWPGCGLFDKTVTFARHLDSGLFVTWTDLNIHLIGQHCFFEGQGSPYRIEPVRLAAVLFGREDGD